MWYEDLRALQGLPLDVGSRVASVGLGCGGSWRTVKPQLGCFDQAKAEPGLWGSPVRTLVKGRDIVLDSTRSKVAQALMEMTEGVGEGYKVASRT